MNIGTKIKTLRDLKKMSQPALAHKLGIAQTTLSNIESGETKKIDFLLMNKVCNEFEVDFEYFLDEKIVNKVKNNNGGSVGGSNFIINNTMPEGIIENILKRIEILEIKN